MKGIDHLVGVCVGGIIEQKRNRMEERARSRRQGSGGWRVGDRAVGTASINAASSQSSIETKRM